MRLGFEPTRHVFFTGKGGVGKTSLACATAVALADSGRRVLLVSTDPASNLDEVLDVALTTSPLAVPGLDRLHALNIDPEAAARAYRDRAVGPYRGVLPPAVVTRMEEELSGACTTEIAAFDEFTRLLADASATAGFDHVVFDTAPTGHTLRLLSLPAAWDTFLATNTSGTSCLGPMAGLQAQHELYRATLATLGDRARTTFVLVTRPDVAAIGEADRTRGELAALGISNLHLAVNGVFTNKALDDPLAAAFAERGQTALAAMSDGLASLPRSEVPLRATPPLGLRGLRILLDDDGADAELAAGSAPLLSGAQVGRSVVALRDLVDSIESAGRGVVLTMGKGGVGKTTVAAAVALELARRGHRVQLTTTDPAAHVHAAIGERGSNLRVSRIDPVAETAAYASEVLAGAARLDERARALLEEDLRSPCTEEVAVFRAFARVVADGEREFVVVDTAPTGHTLLLLDAAEAYHRQVERTRGELPDSVRRLLPRLRDPAFARVVLVAVPEATPVHEALGLQDDLRRAGIEPFAWVLNQAFAGAPTRHPVLRARGAREGTYVREVVSRFAGPVALAPWVPIPPVGSDGLFGFLHSSAAAVDATPTSVS